MDSQPISYQLEDIDTLQQRVEDGLDWSDVDGRDLLPQNTLFDFTPSPQQIKYYNRLRHALNQQESQTERVFHLTAYILALNSNNYYALMLRRGYTFVNVVRMGESTALNRKLLDQELHFVNCLLNENPKEYQLWNYKKDLLAHTKPHTPQADRTQILSAEFEFLTWMLVNDDPRNYHVWDYLNAVVRSEGPHLMREEFEKTRTLLFFEGLAEGCRNVWADVNSVWSYRFNLLKSLRDMPDEKPFEELLREEYVRVLAFILQNQRNECVWNYLLGMHDELSTLESAYTAVKTITSKMQAGLIQKDNRFALNFLLQAHYSQPQQQKIYIQLLQKCDPTRELYYNYLLTQLSQQSE